MEIIIDNTKRIVEIWRTNADCGTSKEMEIQEKIQTFVAMYEPMKYTIAIYESGNCDLLSNTIELLLYNRKKLYA